MSSLSSILPGPFGHTLLASAPIRALMKLRSRLESRERARRPGYCTPAVACTDAYGQMAEPILSPCVLYTCSPTFSRLTFHEMHLHSRHQCAAVSMQVAGRAGEGEGAHDSRTCTHHCRMHALSVTVSPSLPSLLHRTHVGQKGREAYSLLHWQRPPALCICRLRLSLNLASWCHVYLFSWNLITKPAMENKVDAELTS